MRLRALQPVAVLQIRAEPERAKVNERVRLVYHRRRRCAIAKIDAQEVHGFEVRHVEGNHSEEGRRGCDGRQAENFVPGNH